MNIYEYKNVNFFNETVNEYSYTVFDENGDITSFSIKNAKWHKLNAPAVICSNGENRWFIEGFETFSHLHHALTVLNYKGLGK